MNKRKPLTLHPKAHKAYTKFVNTARLVNQQLDSDSTSYVYEDLIHIFELGTALLNRRLMNKEGGVSEQTTSKKSLYEEMKEAECISYIQQTYLNYGKYDPETLKFPSIQIDSSIQDIMNLRDPKAIRTRKVAILKALDLKQIQEGRQHFIVHKSFSKHNQEVQKKEEFKHQKFEELVSKIKNSWKGEFYDDNVKDFFRGAREEYNLFKDSCHKFGVEVFEESSELVFRYTGGTQ